jgi:hypothetical protein
MIEARTKPPRSKKLKQACEHGNLLINKIETNMLTFEVTKLNMHVSSQVLSNYKIETSSHGCKHTKKNQRCQGQSSFQGLHLTHGIPMLVYFPMFCIFHTHFTSTLC